MLSADTRPPISRLTAYAVFWGLAVTGTMIGFLAGGWLFDCKSGEFVANSISVSSEGVKYFEY